MFLTLEDFKKIEAWLKLNSKKDTDFDFADSIDGSETIVIVQGNKNKRISLRDFINEVGNLFTKDLVNVSADFELHGITLETAIQAIPLIDRKEGLVITFEDTDSNWRIYQFIGELLLWNIVDLWQNVLNWESFAVDSLLPDEEDITATEPDGKGNAKLKFADKEYNPDAFSGLGHIILRKNLVEINDPLTGKSRGIVNFLYQDMINKENTIYEIKYDFDLNGLTIIIPNNCTLYFNGGSILNGIIISTLTIIDAKPVNIFGENIELQGTWKTLEAYPEWFGAKANGVYDDGPAILKAIDYFNTIKLNNGYYVNTTIGIYKPITLQGKAQSRGVNSDLADYTITCGPNITLELFYVKNNHNNLSVAGTIFRDLKLRGVDNSLHPDDRNTFCDQGSTAFYFPSREYSLTFERVTINGFYRGLWGSVIWNCTYNHLIFNRCTECINIAGTVTSSSFIDCVFYTTQVGMYFRGGTVYTSVIDCGFDGVDTGIRHHASGQLNIINCGWEGWRIGITAIQGENPLTINLLGGFFMDAKREECIALTGSALFNCYSIQFEPQTKFSASKINFYSCENFGDRGIIHSLSIDGEPIDRISTINAFNNFYQKGTHLFNINGGITKLNYTVVLGLLDTPNFLDLSIEVLSGNKTYIGKVKVLRTKEGIYYPHILNPEFNDLVNIEKVDSSMVITLLLPKTLVKIEATGKGVDYIEESF